MATPTTAEINRRYRDRHRAEINTRARKNYSLARRAHRQKRKRYYKTHAIQEREKALVYYYEKSQAYQAVRHRAIRSENYALINTLKDKPCLDCGQRFPPCAMDFDHVQGGKKFTIGSQITRPMRVLLEEIEKCELLCANCHRIRTFKRGREKRGGAD